MTYIDFLQVFVLRLCEWFNEVLLDVVLQVVLYLRQVLKGLPCLHQTLTWKPTHTAGQTSPIPRSLQHTA